MYNSNIINYQIAKSPMDPRSSGALPGLETLRRLTSSAESANQNSNATSLSSSLLELHSKSEQPDKRSKASTPSNAPLLTAVLTWYPKTSSISSCAMVEASSAEVQLKIDMRMWEFSPAEFTTKRRSLAGIPSLRHSSWALPNGTPSKASKANADDMRHRVMSSGAVLYQILFWAAGLLVCLGRIC